MHWKPWIVGFVALVVFDALLVFGVRAYRAGQLFEASPAGKKADILSASSQVVRSAPPAVPPLRTACVNAQTWVYDPSEQGWVRLVPVVRCDPTKP